MSGQILSVGVPIQGSWLSAAMPVLVYRGWFGATINEGQICEMPLLLALKIRPTGLVCAYQ